MEMDVVLSEEVVRYSLPEGNGEVDFLKSLGRAVFSEPVKEPGRGRRDFRRNRPLRMSSALPPRMFRPVSMWRIPVRDGRCFSSACRKGAVAVCADRFDFLSAM